MEWSTVVLLAVLASSVLILRHQMRDAPQGEDTSGKSSPEGPQHHFSAIGNSSSDAQTTSSATQLLPAKQFASVTAKAPVQALSDEQLADEIERAMDAYLSAIHADRDGTREDNHLQLLLAEEERRFPHDSKVGPSASLDDEADDEENYLRFVEEIWTKSGVDLTGIKLRRDGFPPSEIDCQKLVWLDNDRAYVCGLVDGRRRVFSCVRGKWFRNGHQIDNSAFYGVSKGLPPFSTLRPQRRPGSVEEALSPEFNHLPVSEKSYVLKYENGSGKISYRVISRINRSRDHFTALCHHRYGQRRTFLYEGIIELINAKSGEIVPTEEFISGDQRVGKSTGSAASNRRKGKGEP